MPWGRHGAAGTRFFDGIVAWLAAACSETTITALMLGPGRASPYWSVWLTHVIRFDRPLYQQVCYELRKMPEIDRLGWPIARFVVSAQTIRRIKIEVLTGLAQAIYLQISPFVSRN